MTEEQIEKLWRDTVSVGNGERTLDMVIKFARAIEAEDLGKQEQALNAAWQRDPDQ